VFGKILQPVYKGKDMNEVRAENLKYLSERGFVVAGDLPLVRSDIGDSPKLRPIGEIFGRLLALKALWLWVDDHPDAEQTATVSEMLEFYKLQSFLTAEENEILNLSREEACQQHGHLMGWKNENCWALAWVLGFTDIPSVEGSQVGGDFGRRLMLDWLPDNAVQCAKLSEGIKLRDPVEVHNLEDLFYCAHNAVRNAQQGSETAPSEFDPVVNGGCIHERRHALTWVLSPGVEWDDTDLST